VTHGESEQTRASDAEREAVAGRLNGAVGEGRLTLEEFSERIAKVYAARTHGELRPLLTDLPAAPGAVAPLRSGHLVPTQAAPAPLLTWVGAIKRRGRWRLAGDTALGVAVGPVKLDLRGAEIDAREVTVAVRTVVGAIKVWVPRGIRVEVDGATAIGTRTVEESNLPPHVDVPTLRLRLDTVVGTVKVYRV
jgi:hypothetical protein